MRRSHDCFWLSEAWYTYYNYTIGLSPSLVHPIQCWLSSVLNEWLRASRQTRPVKLFPANLFSKLARVKSPARLMTALSDKTSEIFNKFDKVLNKTQLFLRDLGAAWWLYKMIFRRLNFMAIANVVVLYQLIFPLDKMFRHRRMCHWFYI